MAAQPSAPVSPAERALAIPLVAERLAHFVLHRRRRKPSPAALARLECCSKGLRAALTPHWRELCYALSPGAVVQKEREASGTVGGAVRYRRLYWQLHTTKTGALLKPRATYTFIADVTLSSCCGEHVCVFSAAFPWHPHDDEDEVVLDNTYTNPGDWRYLLRPSWEHTSVTSEAAKPVTRPYVDAECELRLCRDDGAVAYLPWCIPSFESSGGVDEFLRAADPRAEWVLAFEAYLTSDENLDPQDRMDVDLKLHFCAAEPPTEGQEHPSRLRVIQRHNPEDRGSMCSPQLLVGFERSEDKMAGCKTVSRLDQLAWATAD